MLPSMHNLEAFLFSSSTSLHKHLHLSRLPLRSSLSNGGGLLDTRVSCLFGVIDPFETPMRL